MPLKDQIVSVTDQPVYLVPRFLNAYGLNDRLWSSCAESQNRLLRVVADVFLDKVRVMGCLEERENWGTAGHGPPQLSLAGPMGQA